MAYTKIEWPDKIIAKFWANVEKSADCWIWKAGIFKGNGYGQFRVGEKKMKAHRVAFLIINGVIPYGKILLHSCDNRLCVNPEHLTPGDNKKNAFDREIRGRGLTGRRIPKIKTRGSLNHAAVLTEEKVARILQLRKEGKLYKDLANEFDVSLTTIALIIRGEKWQHVQR